ncbi:putative photosystem II [Helianthus annuus]|nr:putative photosystem II [Helianthus annuus]
MASASVSSLSTIFSSSNSKPFSSTKPKPSSSSVSPLFLQSSSRRQFLKGSSTVLLPLTTLIPLHSPSVSLAKEVEVGSYLPLSSSDPSFVLFQASSKDTPALRAGDFSVYVCGFDLLAGNVQPYKFVLPPTWKQLRIANILSGNYCQPKCAEPWIEVKFEDEKQGKVQVVASPLIRLTNKPNATLEDIGSPEKVIGSLGPFVTGNTLDLDEELVETSVEKIGDQTYYRYVLETPFALTGSHNIAKATAKGNTVILFVASANDKQWPTSKKTLKAIVDSFQV